ncbi:hypothetical protein ACFVIY_17965 [Streptomyces sp. NPDC127166]|uniref:hypothetical protein n=1 Tax=Streptomyces sp. NPDC127166 TaxID=3345380 RepID=UPI003640BFAC
MTTDQALRDAKARWMRRRRRLIGYGQWQPFADAGPVRQHVKDIQAVGMSVDNIATVTGISASNLSRLLYSNCGRPPISKMRTETAATLLAYWPTLDDFYDAAIVDATGTRRRARALAAMGWPVTQIHHHISFCNVKTLEEARSATHVTARLARAVRDFYKWASVGTAEGHGITPWLAKRGRGYASRQGWEDPSVWDEDTMDDPGALPEWTGFCGSDRGWWTHRLEHIPVCEPCQAAHDQWIQDRKHLSNSDRYKALGRARAEASNRGAAIAEDARELIRLGADYETAAQRIGVTRNHLQQELLRNPDLRKEAA